MNITTHRDLESRVGCIESAMGVIGSKWTALILRDLAGGPQRFCALEKSISRINPRTLSKRLDDLEAGGIITRQPCEDMPQHAAYTLTRKGKDLIPLLRQMAAWGEKYSRA